MWPLPTPSSSPYIRPCTKIIPSSSPALARLFHQRHARLLLRLTLRSFFDSPASSIPGRCRFHCLARLGCALITRAKWESSACACVGASRRCLTAILFRHRAERWWVERERLSKGRSTAWMLSFFISRKLKRIDFSPWQGLSRCLNVSIYIYLHGCTVKFRVSECPSNKQ